MSNLKNLQAELHEELTTVLLKIVKTKATDENGNPVPPNAAYLNVARQLLKDNNVSAVPVAGSPLKGLAEAMPFPVSDSPSLDVH